MDWTTEAKKAARKLKKAREAEAAARREAALVAAGAASAGITEVAAAETLGVDRMTIRKWKAKAAAQ